MESLISAIKLSKLNIPEDKIKFSKMFELNVNLLKNNPESHLMGERGAQLISSLMKNPIAKDIIINNNLSKFDAVRLADIINSDSKIQESICHYFDYKRINLTESNILNALVLISNNSEKRELLENKFNIHLTGFDDKISSNICFFHSDVMQNIEVQAAILPKLLSSDDIKSIIDIAYASNSPSPKVN